MEARIDRVTGAVNTWLVGDDIDVIVVDPGESAQAVLDAVGDREIAAVICTHGHRRHVAAAFEVAKRDDAPVALHPGDRLPWRDAHGSTEPDIDMEDGGVFEVGDVSLEVIFAPGHTSGSVCLYCDELGAVFTGDVVTLAGPVPHDGYFNDFARQIDSIGGCVLTLDGQTRVLPGHGEETTVAVLERKFDSWVSGGPDQLLDALGDDE
ncbi:MAG TPA: MBL fold metallo-hydrolase [Streptosporangiaceae bacterium]|jgi:glyoxylase-like metal-dependent hydrolase (beta-lactamase superfamily II)|nr:MBL fold metallo-hydrolase [Streptosporangiaceae bacterium]